MGHSPFFRRGAFSRPPARPVWRTHRNCSADRFIEGTIKNCFKLCIHSHHAWSAAQAPLLHEVRSAMCAACERRICSRRTTRRAFAAFRMAAICAIAVSGCTPGSTVESKSDPASASAASPTDPQTCRLDRALLVAQPAPDCGFGRADLKTLDPDQWIRLKLEYELKCYKEAEKIARMRLRLLQAATRCEATPAR